MAQSIEPNIADLANGWLKQYKLDYKLEQEKLNTEIDKALNEYYSKKRRCRRQPSRCQTIAAQHKKRAGLSCIG